MIFKTFDSKLDKWTSKIGIFGKSFNELGTAVNNAFKSVINNLDNFDEDAGFWSSLKDNLFPKKEDIKNQLVDVMPEINTNNISDTIEKIKVMTSDVSENKSTWQNLFDTLPESEKHLAQLGQQLEGQIITEENLVKANQQARTSAISHNEAIKAQTLSAKAGKAALQALATAGNMLAGLIITKGIELIVKGFDNWIHRIEKANGAIEDTRSKYEEAKSEIESMNSELAMTNQKIAELESKGVLSFTDKSELERLRQQNDELERSITLQEKKKAIAASETVNGIQQNKKDLFDDFDNAYQNFNYYKREYEDTDKTGRKGMEIGEVTPENYETTMRTMESLLLSSEKKLLGKIEIFESYKEDIINKYNTDDFSQYSASDKKLYEDIIQQLQNAYHAVYSDSEYNKIVIEPIFRKDKFKDLYDQLIKYFISGGSTDLSALEEKFGSDIITSLYNACNNVGVDFNKLVQDIYENSQHNLDKIAPVVKVPRGAFEAKQNLVSKNIRDFIENDLSEEDRTLLLYAEIPEDRKFGTISDVKEFIGSLKNTIDDTSISFSDIFALEDAEGKLNTLGRLNDELNTIQSAYQNLSGAIDAYSSAGYITIDQFRSIVEQGADFLDYLTLEEGQLGVNEQAMYALAESRIAEMKAQMLQGITDNVSKIKQEGDEAAYLTSTNYELKESYDALAYAKLYAWRTDALASGLSQGTVDRVMKKAEDDIAKINALAAGIDVNTLGGISKSATSAAQSMTDLLDKELNVLDKKMEAGYTDFRDYIRDRLA
ncbi:MAG: hypothetical protein NC345_01750, partial [Lachnospira sp.]|nr:hypothetical protein [Lachnospira sp.]